MIKEVILALCLGLLIAVPTTTAATGIPQWTAKPMSTTVPLGSPVVILVTGPPNGTFTVALFAFPFNSSPPLVSGLFSLPAIATLPNGTAAGQASLNTTYLGVESVMAQVSEGAGTIIAEPILSITLPSDNALASQLQQDNYTINLLELRQQALLYQQTQLETDYWAAITVCCCLFVVLVILILFTRSAVGGLSPVRRTLNWWHNRGYTKEYVQNTGPWEVNPDSPRPRARVTYVCLHCDQRGFTRDEAIQHARTVEGIAVPALNRNYAVSGETVRKTAKLIEARAPRVEERRRVNVPVVDLSEEEA